MPMRGWLAPFVYLSSNWISLIGVVLTTTGGLLWLILLPSMIRGSARDPYLGILQFMVLPAIFFAGLALIPLGIWSYKKRNRGALPEVFPPLDLSNPRFRRLLAFIAVTTLANIVIGAQFTYRAMHYMETVSFCGQTCHTVMKPEFTAYQNSPHSRVACVECHIGAGANWFVKSKISGSWQVVSVAFNLYPRPIPTPIENLRPARETCEVCHWPQKYGGDAIRVRSSFTDDEQTKELKTVLLLHIGGGNGYRGIHGAHMGPGVEIRYAHSDPRRTKIPWVEYSRGNERRIYMAEGYSSDSPGSLPVRVMECIDCHTRPSHSFDLPERAIDKALLANEVDRSLPFVRKAALEVMKQDYKTEAEALAEVPRRFIAYYEKNHPAVMSSKRAAVESSAKAVLAAFSRNVFPDMNVKWGYYINNIGHTDFDGCFRCHDERGATAGDRTITQDCDTCHKILAQEEESPKVLADLGLAQTAGKQ
ncbi:MAG: NapC/NirT family cytochrome c [Bryobacteraceae bacterium]|nr:NapC/NirT family cytochrome c [Bryobacteraceae bacterium]